MKRYSFLIIAALALIADQCSKYWATRYLLPIREIRLVDGIFTLTYVRNRGVAFGMMQGSGMAIAMITIILIGWALWWAFQRKQLVTLEKWALGLVIGGSIGNLIDRIRLGYVVDFFDFQIWPVFNVADICICTAAVLWMYQVWLQERAALKAQSDAENKPQIVKIKRK